MTRRWYVLVLYVIAAAFVINVSIVIATNASRWGKTEHYVKVTSMPTDSGDDLWQYEYRLPSYTAEGSGRVIEFSAPKVLRRDAYLRIYARDDGSTTAWEEVGIDEIPDKAREQLE